MKKRFAYLSSVIILVVCASLSITQVSCKKDGPCDKVTCQNNGTCLDGTCSCPPGFSGTNCEVAYKTTFVGSYNGSDSAAVPQAATVAMAADTGAYGLSITTNSLTFKALVINNVLTIPTQIVQLGSFIDTISGSGVFNLPVVKFSYTENVNGTRNTTVFTGNKQ